MIYKKELDELACQLIKNGETVSVAESVTAGGLQAVFSNVENASGFFEGGISAYNLRQKCTHLFIDETHAISCNCVSEKVAEEMALGISRSFKTNWSIGITGYASPVPELKVEQLYACYAISFNGEILKKSTLIAVTEAPEAVQYFYVMAILEEFISLCNKRIEVPETI